MDMQKISNRIFYLPSMEETDRPVLGYIKGDRYSLMVDAGNSPKHVSLYNTALEKVGLPSPDYVAITHWHWDHTYGICAVEGKVIASRLTNEELKKMMLWNWTDDAMAERLQNGEDIEFCDNCIRLEYPNCSEINVQTADIIFDKSLTIDLGGIHCELIHIGGPHSDDSVAIYVPEEKVIFISDADCEDYYFNNGLYNKEKLENLIEVLKKIDFKTYIRGHDVTHTRSEALDSLEKELRKL